MFLQRFPLPQCGSANHSNHQLLLQVPLSNSRTRCHHTSAKFAHRLVLKRTVEDFEEKVVIKVKYILKNIYFLWILCNVSVYFSDSVSKWKALLSLPHHKLCYINKI